MNRYIVAFFGLLIVFAVIVASCFLYNNNNIANVFVDDIDSPTVIVDAGHGGEDGGTCSADGVLEKDINLSVSLYLYELLKCSGYNVIMTRTDDEQIGDNTLSTIRQRKISDVRKRLEMTKTYPDSLFVSIHQNYYSSSRYSGAQVFYSSKSPDSRLLADSIQNSIVGLLQNGNDRKIKEIGTNVYLLYNCENPAVMVECGFLSNSEEAKLLTTDDYQKKVAFSVACGIIKFLEEENG